MPKTDTVAILSRDTKQNPGKKSRQRKRGTLLVRLENIGTEGEVGGEEAKKAPKCESSSMLTFMKKREEKGRLRGSGGKKGRLKWSDGYIKQQG